MLKLHRMIFGILWTERIFATEGKLSSSMEYLYKTLVQRFLWLWTPTVKSSALFFGLCTQEQQSMVDQLALAQLHLLSSSLVPSFGEDSNNMSYSNLQEFARICKKYRCLAVCTHSQMKLRAELVKDLTQCKHPGN